jgi:hypothetical protein
MAVRPVVDGVQRDYGDALKVIRLNIQDPVGRELARRYRFEFTPSFVLIDGDGRELWRSVYVLDPARIRASLPLD